MKIAHSAPHLDKVLSSEIAFPLPRNGTAGLVATDRAAREEILHRAYAIWEREGRPENRHLAHWVQAEAEIMHPADDVAIAMD
jgi:hypothetical protein